MANDTIALTISVDGIRKTLSRMVGRAQLVEGWLNRVAYPMIIEAQRMRWASEGASEGDSWKPLNPRYESQKLKRFRDYPGSGRKMLIATSRLVDSVTGDSTKEHYKLVSDRSLEVGSTVPYAKFVDDERNFTELSDQTTQTIADKLSDYIRNG